MNDNVPYFELPRRVGLPVVIAGGLITAVTAAGIADSIIAMRVERDLSMRVQDSTNLETPPSVFVGGLPYLQALVSGEIPEINVSALDVNVQDIGMINSDITVKGVQVDRDQVFNGDFVGAQAQSMRRSLRFDGVAMGALLDITDLDISHPEDISPTGGTTPEAVLHGTPPGFRQPVSVAVELRLHNEEFTMTPTEVLAGTADSNKTNAQTLAAFDLSFDTRRLPMSMQADAVYLEGGSIIFEAVRSNIALQPGNLTPVGTQLIDESGTEIGPKAS